MSENSVYTEELLYVFVNENNEPIVNSVTTPLWRVLAQNLLERNTDPITFLLKVEFTLGIWSLVNEQSWFDEANASLQDLAQDINIEFDDDEVLLTPELYTDLVTAMLHFLPAFSDLIDR